MLEKGENFHEKIDLPFIDEYRSLIEEELAYLNARKFGEAEFSQDRESMNELEERTNRPNIAQSIVTNKSPTREDLTISFEIAQSFILKYTRMMERYQEERQLEIIKGVGTDSIMDNMAKVYQEKVEKSQKALIYVKERMIQYASKN